MKLPLPDTWSFALRNVLRQRLRSAATLVAIGMGVAGLILAGGFIQDIYVQLGEALIHSQTGHLQIAREGYREGRTRAPENYLIENSDRLKEQVRAQPGTQMVLARLGFAGMINNGRRDLGIIGEGVEPSAEAALGSYLTYIEGRPLADGDLDGIVLGEGVAKTLGLKAGDRANLVISLSQGAVNTLDFEVIGVFQSFSKEFDARAVRIPLAAARNLMDTAAAHLLVVVLDKTEDTARVQAALGQQLAPQGYEIVSWRQLSDFYDKTVQLYQRQFGVLRFIILLMVLLSVINSVNMTIFERTREFGTMLAIGDRPIRVFRMILAENVLIGLAGALVGMLLGCLAAWLISAIGISMPPPPNANVGYTALIRLVPLDILSAGAIGFVATNLASVIPARRASRLPIVDAL
ncbi:MAG TPA: ABC transporter permease, partial [Accumulibacter sp.]|nr:ABC transporter permease [Accumulibacter sp.]